MLHPMGTGRVFHGQQKDGTTFPLDIGLNPLATLEGGRVVCSLVDVSRRDALSQEIKSEIDRLRQELANLEHLVSTDELTGVLNRRVLMKQLELHIYMACHHQEPLSVAMIDVDYFKQINDTSGHLTGDEILRQFVDTVREMVRGTDMLGRYGGDEFVLLMPNTPADQAHTVLERIRAGIAAHAWPVPGVSTSVGFTTWIPGEKELPSGLLADELLLEADIALYHVKQSGRNTVQQFSPGALRPAL